MNKLLRDRTVLLTLATLALGGALQVREGLYSPYAIALLASTVVLAFAALFSRPLHDHDSTNMLGPRLPFLLLTLVLTLVFLFAGIRVLRSTASPHMDVFVFQRDACAAIVNGVNPYTISYPNIYGPSNSFVYDASFVSGDRLSFGFPYMPLTLWFDLLGHAGFSDYRYSNLTAITLAAICIASVGWSSRTVFAAALLLFTPRGLFVLENGWTEPLTVMLLAATILASAHYRPAVPYALGLLLASKQYMILAIPLVPLLTEWRDWRFHLKAASTLAVVTLPLALWDVGAFWDNAVLLQFKQPFRDDALSFAALLFRWGFPKPPTIVPLLLALIVAITSVKLLARSAHSFALAFSLTFLAFFAFNKQAFANYYFLVIAALCCAIASFKPAEPIVR